MLIPLLLSGIAVIIAVFVYTWWRSYGLGHPHGPPTPLQLALGAVTLFFDTLGIGNYAPTTAAFRFLKMVDDALIPGTLNVGTSVPVAVEAFAFVTAIAVDPLTLLTLVPLGAVGGYVGARIVSSLPRRPIQAGMGVALLSGAALMLMTNLQWIPGGGTAIGFAGLTLVFATLVNFVLGGLNALGIGSYAPSLIVFSLLGMDPRAAFPIMMGSAAYMLPMAGIKFARTHKFDGQAALGITLGGIPGVLVAAYVVKSLPLVAIRWLVVVVVLYAGVSLLRAAARSRERSLASAA
ncbi:MAG TPA: sulfite exporter TauE/SafE family protein [Vicinamibacterales bacterium]|nr:sulfite exporter TauE/SafE family protein [Vicinamibacterales bacterium]